MAKPTSYRAEYVREAYNLCLLGATDEELARAFGVAASAIYRWREKYPDFAAACRQAKDEADAKVAESLYRNALGYEHKSVKLFYDPRLPGVVEHEVIERYPPHAASCIFWLKNRQPGKWRDRVEQQLTGKDGEKLEAPIVQVYLPDNGRDAT